MNDRQQRKKILFLAGLPKAGKSLLAGAMYHTLRQENRSFFLERLSPDSEGVWTWDSGREELARMLKNELKKAGEFFSPAFVEFKCQSIKGLAQKFDILLLDMGGVPSTENEKFVKTALTTKAEVKAIILYKEGQDYSGWEEFFKKLGISPIPVKTEWDFNNDVKNQAMSLAQKILQEVLK